jgi:hypothetical protein
MYVQTDNDINHIFRPFRNKVFNQANGSFESFIQFSPFHVCQHIPIFRELFSARCYLEKIFFGQNIFWTKYFFGQNNFCQKYFFCKKTDNFFVFVFFKEAQNPLKIAQ